MPTATGALSAADVVTGRQARAGIKSLFLRLSFLVQRAAGDPRGLCRPCFEHGLCYASISGRMEGLLDGMILTSFSTSGAPERWVDSTGALKALMTVFDLHLYGVRGLRRLDRKHFADIVSNMTKASAADVLKQGRRTLDGAFEPPVISA